MPWCCALCSVVYICARTQLGAFVLWARAWIATDEHTPHNTYPIHSRGRKRRINITLLFGIFFFFPKFSHLVILFGFIWLRWPYACLCSPVENCILLISQCSVEVCPGDIRLPQTLIPIIFGSCLQQFSYLYMSLSSSNLRGCGFIFQFYF